MSAKKFIEQIAPLIAKHAPRYGICVCSPIIAQGILESAKGTSELAINALNFFGLKYKKGRCPTASDVYLKVGSEQNADGSYSSSVMKWCKFNSMEDCVIGYFDFISHSRYAGLKGITDPKTYLETIKSAGYATSLDYVDNLMKVIESYDLTKYDNVKEDTNMATKIIALDAGHGLKTAGKQTPDGIKEWTLNDKVRDKIVAMLKDYDVKFIFPDNNEGNADEGLSKRRAMYINGKADVAVSIHHNAYLGTWCTATGVSVYVDRNHTAKDMELANLIRPKLAQYTGLKSRGVKKANFTVIYQNNIPAVLVEGGFMDNKKDHAVITSDAGQTAYAKAVAEALIVFLKLKKKNTKTEVTKPATTTSNDCPFKVKFLEDMNVRKAAGTKYDKVTICKKNVTYTIVETTKVGTALWGKLKSGAGWVCIAAKYCKRV